MDLIQMLVNLASDLTSASIDLALALGLVGGVAALIIYLNRQVGLARDGRRISGYSMLATMCLCASLITLPQVMNAAAHQVGFGDVSFDAISYAPSSFGAAADGINAVLTILRAVGVWFFYRGVCRMKRSLVDGHTGLSAGEDVGSGTTMAIVGILLTCNPELLTALGNTLKLAW
ncbi:conjugal transfer protein TraQ [Salmonella enterica subsp. enterica serovar Infantis]|nr:conjugal transfer protein TraQ [Salmonella enterica subsp. enterica serovar Saintpaul]EBZ0491368.1 conjugal transfer protein TraQ [Salmonella enterica subsp. enterica serovar Infantis]ECL7345024.1 conjugal transfer protein TraQ [Salmonella enterica subsp. enterica serovar Menston]EGI5922740.1 conjugal transfer protein TraQ [Salmonella enterica subsp. enterica serovar Colindale]ELV9460692.1 conjugal transfer protein TraQ [Salmonella enterica]